MKRSLAASPTDGRAVNTLTIWWDDAADGPTNMAADECLAAEAERRGSLLLRFYGWSQTTVSLGGFQKIDEARQIAAIRGVPLVRRPSGGGAIVHGSDLTYAAAVPKSHPWGASPQVFYDVLHGAMVDVLADHGIRAWPHPACETRPLDDDALFFCFDRRATGDLVMAGPVAGTFSKVMGSAQRRLAGVVLQHGSLLLRRNPAVDGPARHPSVADMVVGPSVPDESGLSRAWGARIAHRLGAAVRAEEAPYVRGHVLEIEALVARFRDERWTARR
jgi:lipoyl(octanoyl) transferase